MSMLSEKNSGCPEIHLAFKSIG